MDAPIPTPGFVQTRVYSSVFEKMYDSTVTLMTLIGPAGSGKSTLATQLCHQMWPFGIEPDEIYFMFQLFNCAKLEDFYSDLVLFYQNIDKTQEKLSPRHPKSWNILQTLFHDMNKHFPNHVKLFILDDVEPIEDILKILNLICQMIRMNPTLESRWKIVLTSQRKPFNTDVYVDIGGDNFFDVDGFDAAEVKDLFQKSNLSVNDTDVREIIARLGQRPLILQICMRSLKENEVENVSECVRNLLAKIESDVSALDQSDREDPLASALVSVKISIERLLNRVPHKETCLRVVKLLTLLNERNITKELLVACAETYSDCPKKADVMIKTLVQCFIERGICTKRMERNVPLFRLHQLVKQSMMLFVREEEKIELIEHALVALTLVIPKDGRKHQTRLVGFYGDHGKSLDRAIKDTNGHTPFILLLHCSMLTSMGYCHLAQRTGDYKEAVKLLKRALNKYCELVLNNRDYNSLLPPEHSGADAVAVGEEAAGKLFVASKSVDWSQSKEYIEYITMLPGYHRLTRKDLDNMVEDPSNVDLINDHLTRDQLHELSIAQKVLRPELLAKVYIAEVLAQIYCVWSTIHRKRDDYSGAVDQCLVNAAAAIKVFSLIFNDYGVYLLAGLITEREMLTIKLPTVTKANEVKTINNQFKELARVGQDQRKKNAYEAGLVRSDLSKDRYHELLCMEGAISCQGSLFNLTHDSGCYEEGSRLFDVVKALAMKQHHKHSTLSYSYKTFARFLSHCDKYGESVIAVLRAMSELRKSIVNGDVSPEHPEFSNPRFRSLYSSLERYYDKVIGAREVAMRARGEIKIREEEKLLKVDTSECRYLTSAIKCWRELCLNTGGSLTTEEPVAETLSQPSENNSTLQCMETILDKEVQEPSTSTAAEGP